MKDPEDDERERQSAMQLKHAIEKLISPKVVKLNPSNPNAKTVAELLTENNQLRQKIRDAMIAFNEILDDMEECESRKELITEICKEALGNLK